MITEYRYYFTNLVNTLNTQIKIGKLYNISQNREINKNFNLTRDLLFQYYYAEIFLILFATIKSVPYSKHN